ncbi:hypothetical protein DSECCO2_557940 [anaerobic digester metagenome]
MQAAAVHQARFLCGGGVQLLGAQGAQQQFLYPGIAPDDIQGVAPLRHGALPQHFSGDDERGAVAFHHFACAGNHDDLAVHAGVQHLAEPMGRAFAQQRGKVLAQVHGGNVEAVDGLPVLHLAGLAEKGRDEVQALDRKPLLLDDLHRQNRIKTAGQQGHGGIAFAFHGG